MSTETAASRTASPHHASPLPVEPTEPTELTEGDYVVHLSHGVARYRGVETIKAPVSESGAPATERDYLVLEYDGNDRLYVSADQIDRVHRFLAADAEGVEPPALDKLRGTNWARSLARAKRQAEESAAELVGLYAARLTATGHAFPPDTPEQRRIEDAFPYEMTPGQASAIADVKRDQEASRPMDRLLVGDVGYGKTEVAVRAAFKAAQAGGRQAAVLCPTSVLASQHFATFKARLKDTGVTVEMLSRFCPPDDQQRIRDGLRDGSVQIVVGTHRLLSADIVFDRLGLVIVDEEQRFGVGHKDRLKELRKTVDVLSMTATPIPRTLNLALSGLLDLSLISDPPPGRTPIETAVHVRDDETIRCALLCEIARGGQAYFVHNRVESLQETAAALAKLVPEARFRIAHGQMSADHLEEMVQAFYDHEFDVLVCTTIIETGIDIPRANTILIDDADHLGLAQLYQLRGRVGRSDQQAYALLLAQRPEAMTPVAAQRLQTLRDFTALGAGYQIAQRDLELRGAGSLLGVRQSGTTAVGTIGLELYFQMVEQAAQRLRDEATDAADAPLPAVTLPIAAGIPESYVAEVRDRLGLYRRMAAARTDGDVDALQGDITARYGSLPPLVSTELGLLRLRLHLRAAHVKSVAHEGMHEGAPRAVLTLRKRGRLTPARIAALCHAFAHRGIDFAEDRIAVSLPTGADADPLAQMEELATALAQK